MVDHAFRYTPDQEPLPQAIGRFPVLERAPGERRGSQGAVYRAQDPASGREVAVKVLANEFESYALSLLAALVGERDMEELRREAQLLAGLRHPNIVAVLETGEDPACGPYVVMEWVPGGDLKARLDKAEARRLSVGEALRITRDILAALAAAHATGVIHRDIKPGNILLDREGRAKLADFGIAGDPGSTAGALPGRGTLGYMAPEQEDPQRAEAVGLATDLYAVGVVLFEMLAGRLPAPGEDVRQLRPDVPSPVTGAITRALNPDPQKRFPSAKAMAQALSQGEPAPRNGAGS